MAIFISAAMFTTAIINMIAENYEIGVGFVIAASIWVLIGKVETLK